MPEFRRIFSNYIRMIMTFSMGIIIVRLLLDKSQEIFSIYTLVTVGIGIGVMLKELLRIALVPRLSSAMASKGNEFSAIFTSCFLASIASAIFGAMLMLIFLANIKPYNSTSGRS